MREMSSFRTGAYNCQGVQDYKKEQMCSSGSNQWGYKGFVSTFNSQSRGIAVLFNNTFEYKSHAPPVKDPEDRFCILDLTLFQQRFTLAAVYRPNNDDPNFFLAFK